MPYDELLAKRVRSLLARRQGFTEKKMFGGVGFLLEGNMCVGVWKEFLILRLGVEAYQSALDEEHVRQFDITGRPMTGWVMVEPDGARGVPQLKAWVDRATAFVQTLPAKENGKGGKPKAGSRRKKTKER
ncbi:MAG: TfoX/Sxy family protein [Pirellulaceae bacterium]